MQSNTVTFQGKEYPIVDNNVVVGSMKIPYFEGWREDDFKLPMALSATYSQEKEVFNRIMPFDTYMKIEQNLITEYATLIKMARTLMSEAQANEFVEHLKLLRMGFATKLTYVYINTLSS